MQITKFILRALSLALEKQVSLCIISAERFFFLMIVHWNEGEMKNWVQAQRKPRTLMKCCPPLVNTQTASFTLHSKHTFWSSSSLVNSPVGSLRKKWILALLLYRSFNFITIVRVLRQSHYGALWRCGLHVADRPKSINFNKPNLICGTLICILYGLDLQGDQVTNSKLKNKPALTEKTKPNQEDIMRNINGKTTEK